MPRVFSSHDWPGSSAKLSSEIQHSKFLASAPVYNQVRGNTRNTIPFNSRVHIQKEWISDLNRFEIIASKLELFKNPIIDFINQEISAERERSIAIVSAPETDKITIHANMEPRL
jgi:hypothetical protein